MGLLVVYDIQLEDGRTDLTWIEDEEKEDTYDRFDMNAALWQEVIELIEQEYGSKVVKYKWEFDNEDEDDDE